MTIPPDKQRKFVIFFNQKLKLDLNKFGAIKHELYKIKNVPVIGRQIIETNRFIERIYFRDDFNIPDYFSAVKSNPETYKLSRTYEEIFRATNIELKVLESV